jgi:hypothetical protein
VAVNYLTDGEMRHKLERELLRRYGRVYVTCFPRGWQIDVVRDNYSEPRFLTVGIRRRDYGAGTQYWFQVFAGYNHQYVNEIHAMLWRAARQLRLPVDGRCRGFGMERLNA